MPSKLLILSILIDELFSEILSCSNVVTTHVFAVITFATSAKGYASFTTITFADGT